MLNVDSVLVDWMVVPSSAVYSSGSATATSTAIESLKAGTILSFDVCSLPSLPGTTVRLSCYFFHHGDGCRAINDSVSTTCQEKKTKKLAMHSALPLNNLDN